MPTDGEGEAPQIVNLRHKRDETEVTQEELAHRSGLNRNYVGMIERCENAPSVDVIGKLAEALSITPGQLFEDGLE